MPIRYSVTIVLILMIFALARGFVLSDFPQLATFGPLHALAEGDGGDGGAGGGSGGDGGSGGGSGGDGGTGGGSGGDGTTDTADGGGAAATWTRYCTGTDAGVANPHPWQIWEYDDSTPPNFRFVEVGTAENGCLSPTPVWTTYCTGANDPNPWQIWRFDDSTPPNYEFVEAGTAANGCAPAAMVAPTCTLTTAPSTINSGEGAALSWATTNATSLIIDQGIGSVTPVDSGSRSISPTVTTTYTGTATGAAGTITCTAIITVIAPPPFCVLTASPTVIQAGQPVTLAWTTTNTDTFDIDQGIGTLFWWVVAPIPNGSRTVYPTVTTTYTGTAYDGGGFSPRRSYQCPATVTVTPPPPPPPFPPPPPGATIRVIKVVINDDGGTRTVADFPLFVNGTAVVSGATNAFNPGTYTVSETNQPGYTSVISGDCSASGGLTLAAGENKVCTITNNDAPGALACILSASPTTISSGGSSTLSWSTTGATSFTIDQGIGSVATTSGTRNVSPTTTTTYTGTAIGPAGTATCSATVSLGGGGGGGGCVSNCGGGGGGGGSNPTVTLSALPHVASQPLAYLYLSQIPYTGLELGPVGTVLYWAALIAWALALAYLVLFGAAPVINRSLRNFGNRIVEALNTEQQLAAAHAAAFAPSAAHLPAVTDKEEVYDYAQETLPEAPRGYSTYDGFKSFAHNGSLSIEDIVKSLSKRQAAPAAPERVPAPKANVEPIYEHVEPIVKQSAEPAAKSVAVTESDAAPAHIRGFIAALVEGDRNAVFAGLRQHVRGGGSAEQLISNIVCLLDDAYRSRVDGTPCDADIVRLVARLSTPTLEKLIGALTNAIDSSYSTGVTGAKLALTRALSVLGA